MRTDNVATDVSNIWAAKAELAPDRLISTAGNQGLGAAVKIVLRLAGVENACALAVLSLSLDLSLSGPVRVNRPEMTNQ